MDITSAKRLFLLGVVASMCATAALAVGVLLFGEFDETTGKILSTTALLSGFSLLALPAGILLDRGRLLPLAWASLALTALSFALIEVLIWRNWNDDPELLSKLTLTATVFAVVSAQASSTSLRRRADDSRPLAALYWGGIGFALAVAWMTTVGVWAEIESDGFYRLLGALAVLAVLATLLQPVVRRISAGAAAARAEPHRVRVTLADGRSLDREPSGRDFAEAVARAVREAEREGAEVVRVERLGAS